MSQDLVLQERRDQKILKYEGNVTYGLETVSWMVGEATVEATRQGLNVA